MAIEFNAGTGANTGTITGLAVGGLPSGIIDADTVANGSIAEAKTSFGGGVKLRHIECLSSSTRTGGFGYIAPNNPNTYTTYFDLTYNKQSSTTTLLTHWLIHGHNSAGAGYSNTSLFCESDADTSINQRIYNGVFPYLGGGQQIVLNGTAHFTTIFPAGNVSLKLQCNNPNTGTDQARPTLTINPNSTEDGRLGSGGVRSSILIMEVDP